MRFGDRNTRFFHISAVNRKKRKAIEALTADSRDFIDDLPTLKSITVDFFRALYTNDVTPDPNASLPGGLFPPLFESSL